MPEEFLEVVERIARELVLWRQFDSVVDIVGQDASCGEEVLLVSGEASSSRPVSVFSGVLFDWADGHGGRFAFELDLPCEAVEGSGGEVGHGSCDASEAFSPAVFVGDAVEDKREISSGV